MPMIKTSVKILKKDQESQKKVAMSDALEKLDEYKDKTVDVTLEKLDEYNDKTVDITKEVAKFSYKKLMALKKQLKTKNPLTRAGLDYIEGVL